MLIEYVWGCRGIAFFQVKVRTASYWFCFSKTSQRWDNGFTAQMCCLRKEEAILTFSSLLQVSLLIKQKGRFILLKGIQGLG